MGRLSTRDKYDEDFIILVIKTCNPWRIVLSILTEKTAFLKSEISNNYQIYIKTIDNIVYLTRVVFTRKKKTVLVDTLTKIFWLQPTQAAAC